MKYPLDFTKPALRDIARAYAGYESQSPGLGADVMAALEAQLERIAEHPNHFPSYVRDARRALLGRFPYLVPFVVEPARIVILGVIHTSRNARFISRRIP